MFGILASVSYIAILVVIKGGGPRDHCLRLYPSSMFLGTLQNLCGLFSHIKMSETTYNIDVSI